MLFKSVLHYHFIAFEIKNVITNNCTWPTWPMGYIFGCC